MYCIAFRLTVTYFPQQGPVGDVQSIKDSFRTEILKEAQASDAASRAGVAKDLECFR